MNLFRSITKHSSWPRCPLGHWLVQLLFSIFAWFLSSKHMLLLPSISVQSQLFCSLHKLIILSLHVITAIVSITSGMPFIEVGASYMVTCASYGFPHSISSYADSAVPHAPFILVSRIFLLVSFKYHFFRSVILGAMQQLNKNLDCRVFSLLWSFTCCCSVIRKLQSRCRSYLNH